MQQIADWLEKLGMSEYGSKAPERAVYAQRGGQRRATEHPGRV